LRSPSYSQSLIHGINALRSFTADHPVLGIAELSTILGCSRSTAHRYASTLVQLGCLEQERGRKYRLVHRTGDTAYRSIHGHRLADFATPWLSWLRSITTLTASLSVQEGRNVVYIAWLASQQPAQNEATHHSAGWRAPAHATAAGKALLAFTPAGRKPLGEGRSRLERCTAATITARGKLLAELASTWQRGYATSNGELADGVRAIAAPIIRHGDAVAAIELTAYANALSIKALTEHADAIQQAARGIANEIKEERHAV
jgi:IclR family pca regulon transcriptional regulator